MRRVFIVVALLLASAGGAAAQPAVFLVRHAERMDAGTAAAGMMAADPDLSDIGRARAEALADTLRDAGITAIYVTEWKRTKQTAEPLAARLGIEATVVPAKDTAALVSKIKAGGGNALVIGHSNTLPEVLAAFGIPDQVTIAEREYDHLFIVALSGRTKLIRLRYR